MGTRVSYNTRDKEFNKLILYFNWLDFCFWAFIWENTTFLKSPANSYFKPIKEIKSHKQKHFHALMILQMKTHSKRRETSRVWSSPCCGTGMSQRIGWAQISHQLYFHSKGRLQQAERALCLPSAFRSWSAIKGRMAQNMPEKRSINATIFFLKSQTSLLWAQATDTE